MGHALRYRDESELPESIRKRLQKRFATKSPDRAGGAERKVRRPRRDLEHNEQVVLMNRVAACAFNEPRFALAAARTHAIPNGGGRSRAEAGRLKAEGVRRGVSDLFVAMPAGGKHGLYIEMKATGGKVSDEQRAWIERSLALGYAAHVCWSADDAFAVWRAYVEASF